MSENKESQKVDPRFPLEGGMHVLKGVRMLPPCTAEHLLNLEKMKVNKNDWFIVTYPKSGTTWTQEIMWLIKSECDEEKADNIPVYVRVPFLELLNIDSATQPGEQVFIKSHLPHHMMPNSILDAKPRVVVVHRHPKDIAVSFYHMYQSLTLLGRWSHGWDLFFEAFITGNVECGSWFSFTRDWWDAKDDSHQLHLTYEWMLNHRRETITKIAGFLDRELSKEMIETIDKRTQFKVMQKNPMTNYSTWDEMDTDRIPFIRKGEPGDWKNWFTVTQNERFDKIYRKEMNGYEKLHEFLNDC